MTFHTKRWLCTRFNKVDGFIRVCDGTRHLVLFESEKMISFRTGLDIFLE